MTEATKPGAQSTGDRRSTGWKIPLAFCAVMLALVGATALWRQEKVDVIPIPAPLLAQAKAIRIDLDATEEGKEWKEIISTTAGAFATRAEKDGRITGLVRRATAAGRYDAACTAAVLMYNDHQRDGALIDVGRAALQSCDTLPWAVMAAGGMRTPPLLARLHEEIAATWESCKK